MLKGKTALPGLTRAVAVEVARTDITCNAICPGTVLTPAIDWQLRQEMQRDGTRFEEAEDAFLAIRQRPAQRRHQRCRAAGRWRMGGRPIIRRCNIRRLKQSYGRKQNGRRTP